MRFEYVKPDLEEIELILEGSFLDESSPSSSDSDHPDVPVDPNPGGGDSSDGDDYWD